MAALTYRIAQKGDEDGLTELHQAVFGVKRNRQFWDWKYWNNPAGLPAMAIALDGEKIVGQVGAVPTEFKLGSKRLLASQTQDIVILPEYRVGTPFFRLEKLAKQDTEEKLHSFHYGFSVETTYRISTKILKFRGVCPIMRLVCILNADSWLAEKLKNQTASRMLSALRKNALCLRYGWGRLRLPKGFQFHQITRFDERFDEFFWKEIAQDYEIMAIRESQYLNWRYFDIPHVNYDVFSLESGGKIKGFVVLECLEEEKRGRIIDIVVPRVQPQMTELLVAFSIRYFLERRMDIIACWMLEHPPVYSILQKQGFVPRQSQRDLIVRSPMTDYPTESFLAPPKWYITHGDCDNY